jgi:glyoxylase-like metal-dependent hydrolase (beta-lactamase superfamily II)
MMDATDIQRLRMGYVVAPPGGPVPAGELVQLCAYVIRHPRGVLLWDTGIGVHPEVDEAFRPVRWPLAAQLEAVGLRMSDVAVVGNCHLHFDHAGGNSSFRDVPILAQRVEHEAALGPGFTIPGIAEFEGARYELLSGDAPVWDGVRVVPTPGHTPGHQTLVVETRQGRVVLAGQSFQTASDYARVRLAHELRSAGYAIPPDAIPPGDDPPPWMPVVEALDPWRVLFAHDVASWERGPALPPAG